MDNPAALIAAVVIAVDSQTLNNHLAPVDAENP
jgi:hypothetical protein